jgi:amino acid adenylation domain-containing protein
MDERDPPGVAPATIPVPCAPRAASGQAALVELIAAQAARTPGRIALAWEGGRPWTYATLVSQFNAIARSLVEHGVAQGDLVGVYLPRRPEMVAAVLGVMRAGAAYVALDPAFPDARLRHMAEHSGLRHVLVWNETEVPSALSAGRQIFALDGSASACAPEAPLPQVTGDDLAYVLYTSGSTGQPKGVRILQRNLVNFLASMQHQPGIAKDDVLCAVTTLSFDIAALELYLPLLTGARVVIATENEQVDPAAFAALLRKHAVTVLQTTPTLLCLLLDSGRMHEVRGMKLLIGGEAMPRALAEAMLAECGELWNMYGPTETTVWSTIQRVIHGSGPVPLGKPIANTAIHVLDEAMQPVAEGEIGEIWIGGAGVADGYLNDPHTTAERFVPDPFATDGSRMYRSGDLGKLRDGVLHFHGRSDDQIKLRGYRIEPGDIEAAALSVPGIREAVAVAREIEEGDKRLILYVVAQTDPALPERLRASLRGRLPACMLPQHVEVLDAMPRTPNGKVDRKALPVPRALAKSYPPSPQSSSDSLESALTAIWSELLKVRNIEPHDDFFDLGGDSLLAVRAFERMQALTGVSLPLATLLAAPTIAGQAAAFRAAGASEPTATISFGDGAGKHWSPLVPIQPFGKRPPLFLLHAIGGNVLNYVPLARALGTDQPAYGIQAVGLDGMTPPLDSLPAMAERYIAEIRRVQPHGPYFLAGGSMGGMIAYEMALQLRAQGEIIGLLAMMDTYGPDYRRVDAEPRATTPSRVVAGLFGRMRRIIDVVRVRRARTTHRPLPRNLRYRELERVHYRALMAYRPRSYDGRAVLFRASSQPRSTRPTGTLGWSHCMPRGIEVIDLNATHDNLIEQPELACRLGSVLRRAQASSPP